MSVDLFADYCPGLSIGSLYAGIDGLALGVQLATGARVAWHAEIDPDASAVLASHWHVPNLGDVSKVNWSRVEPVDILVGGFPCQDISLAGKGKGIDGPKSKLWRHYVAAIRALRPRFALVENVSALLTRGMDRVARDLAESGYRFTWSSFSSEAVGAPHRRERMFVLATPDAALAGPQGRDQRRPQQSDDGRRCEVDADPDSIGLRDQLRDWSGPTSGPVHDGAEPAHADGIGLERIATGDGEAAASHEPPGHDPDGRSAKRKRRARRVQGGDREVGANPGPKTAAARHLNPAFVEWMMGFPDGWTAALQGKPSKVRRARLRLLGNAVQPQVAQAAWLGLRRRLATVQLGLEAVAA